MAGKWQDWKTGYMAADQNYLVHASRNASDHKYFVGTFTGRFKETGGEEEGKGYCRSITCSLKDL